MKVWIDFGWSRVKEVAADFLTRTKLKAGGHVVWELFPPGTRAA